MSYNPANPLIVQSDHTLLLETRQPQSEAARKALAAFTTLEKSPEYVHSYRITPLSLWNAAAAGLSAEEILARLAMFARYPLPPNVVADVREWAGRWGRLRLEQADSALQLVSDDAALFAEVLGRDDIAALLDVPPATREMLRSQPIQPGPRRVAVPPERRGALKQALVAAGWPVYDLAGYASADALAIQLRLDQFGVRDYQRQAAEAFYAGGEAHGGSGVVVLPPGAGKTVVGIQAMALIGAATLILTTNRTSVNQWRRELLAKTSLAAEQIAEYTGGAKGIAMVTIATYQMLTQRDNRSGEFPHLHLFSDRAWGLVIYDEVHLLPAPVFRATAAIQARRRLGLTATLVREDGREADVFALIGPKKYDAPWRDLERRGWIATANCIEVRVGLPDDERMAYALAERRDQHRIAAENPRKLPLLRTILERHPGAPTLIIGQYLGQLQYIADNLAAPLISGAMPQSERERLFEAFRRGEESLLVISRVGNFALDLPDAELLVQVSGLFGSRQEEAQRLGRILRPKPDGRQAHFYSIVSRDTSELEFAHNRQLFLAEQGYAYQILDAAELMDNG